MHELTTEQIDGLREALDKLKIELEQRLEVTRDGTRPVELDERALLVIYMKVHPCYEPLRADERYQRCLERLGLSD